MRNPSNNFIIIYCLFLVGWVGIASNILSESVPSDKTPPADTKNTASDLEKLKNILKSISTIESQEEKYRLFIQAESLFNKLKKHISNPHKKRWKKWLKNELNLIPPPENILYQGISFKLRKYNKKRHVYWSSAITEGFFVTFLNAIKFPRDEFIHSIYPKHHTISINKKNTYQTRSKNAPVQGVNLLLTKKNISWISDQWDVKLLLPTQSILSLWDEGISCWTLSKWKEKNPILRDIWERFQGKFYVLHLQGKPTYDLPEAFYPEVSIHMIMRTNDGKRLYLRLLELEKKP